MYKVDHAAAAAFHLVLHSAGGLHIFDHASRPAVDTVAGCSSQPNGSQHCNRVITNRISVVLKSVIASFQRVSNLSIRCGTIIASAL